MTRYKNIEDVSSGLGELEKKIRENKWKKQEESNK